MEMVLDGYSARVIREWYTHIGSLPTRLQASTRYINYENLEFVTPLSLQNKPEALGLYEGAMEFIKEISRECVVSVAHTGADYETTNAAFGAALAQRI